MTCKKCGTAVEDGKKFCPTCGNPMAAPEAAAGTRADPCSGTRADPCSGTRADRSSRRQRNPQCSGKSV